MVKDGCAASIFNVFVLLLIHSCPLLTHCKKSFCSSGVKAYVITGWLGRGGGGGPDPLVLCLASIHVNHTVAAVYNCGSEHVLKGDFAKPSNVNVVFGERVGNLTN